MLTITFINCEKENDFAIAQNEEVVKSLYKQRTVSLSQIPEIKNYISTKIRDGIFSKTDDGLNPAIFDTENILEVIDTLNNANYSFQFKFTDTPLGEFYNLIIDKTALGEFKTPIVFHYKCDESYLEQYIEGGYNFLNFKGSMARHKYTDFFQEDYFSDRGDPTCPTEFDDVGDPIPCEEEIINTSGSGGGATSIDADNTISTTGGSVDTSSSTSCTYVGVYVMGCGASNSSTLHPVDSCGGDLVIATYYAVWDCSSGINRNFTNKGETCPDCTTDTEVIPVNPIPIETMRSTLKRNLTLSPNAISYIGSSNNNDNVEDA